MNPRAKLHLLCFVALPAGFVGLALLLNLIHPFLPLLAPLCAVPIGILIERVRCPQCDKPIARRWSAFLAARWLVRSCFPDRYCVHCGYDLDQPEPRPAGASGMKRYRVSLEVTASPVATDAALADLLGLPRAALAREQQGDRVLWRYEPSTGQTGTLAHRLVQLASEVHAEARSARELQDAGASKVSLGLDVHHDTFVCVVGLPLGNLVSLSESLPELSTVELTCSPSDGDITPSASASKGDANEYIVSLDAITSAAATAAEVAGTLGLPPEAFTVQRAQDEAIWTCEAEEDRTTDLAGQIGQLVSAARPPQPFRPGGAIRSLFLDIGVVWHVDETTVCAVSLPVPLLRSLVEKLPVGYVRVRCYPGSGEEGGQ